MCFCVERALTERAVFSGWLPLPDPAPYVPSKTGVDRAVQVDVRGLFNFDYEVEPLLEVLVGKTLETAELEVAEEQEMLELEEKKTGFVLA